MSVSISLAALPMPPGEVSSELALSGQRGSGTSGGRSKLLNMPMPPTGSPTDEEGNGSSRNVKGGGKARRKPRVIGKAPPTKMTEDGTDWGERCIDIYEIVDRVSVKYPHLPI